MRFSLVYVLFGAASLAQAQVLPVTTYAPVPPKAEGPSVNSDGFRVQSFGGGAYMVTDDQYQAPFFVSNIGVIMIDAPPTIGHNILNGIRTVTDLPITHQIYSHHHADHIGAAYLLTENATIIAHELTAWELSITPNPNMPQPNITFVDQYILEVDNQTLMLDYHGPVHDPGNIFIYAPTQKVLIVIDIVFPGWTPYFELAEACNVPFFYKAMDMILKYEFDVYIGGHLDRIGSRQDVLTQREYMTDMFNTAREALLLSAAPPNSTNNISAAAIWPPIERANPGNYWPLYLGYMDNLAQWCTNVTYEKWLGVLGGVDVYTLSHCETLVESIRIDYGLLGPLGVQAAST